MSRLSELISSDKLKATVAVVAAVVMYIVPDPYDAIITGLLSAFGISNLIISEKKSDDAISEETPEA